MTVSLGAIDDDTSILYTLEAMAESQGWKMHTSTNWQEALDWVRRKEVDILLVDYHMPEISGREVIKKSRALSKDVVILVLTIEENPEIARELILAGADDFVLKPLRLADFTSRIALHARLAQYRRMPGVESLGKGINPETLRVVIDALHCKKGEKSTAREVAKVTGLSYQTAHRYLEHLVASGITAREPVYREGHPGRPMFLYSLSENHDS
ncbi:MAG TPA: response regulator [Synergistaceae bacterium]|jgi:response regulator of citrate/malate metabolism|nr:MAG: Response regulator receiver protein [Synergistales bacterium 53_16]KUL01048.1 MAG: Response regulator receiver protein [Synergistales bacterium 54_9]HAA47078.1 response regulator [Synergistaceae bacterium]HAG23013.1 response regulator [Synergistaceae bacterium]